LVRRHAKSVDSCNLRAPVANKIFNQTLSCVNSIGGVCKKKRTQPTNSRGLIAENSFRERCGEKHGFIVEKISDVSAARCSRCSDMNFK
jgi:hypothetical protein